MKQLILATLGLLPAICFSGQSIYAPGPNSTLGRTSNAHHLTTVIHNPAAGSLVVNDEETVRFSYISSFGLYFEYGDADNFTDELDELVDLLDDSNIPLDQADETLTRFNNVLAEFSESGYLKGSGDAPIPLFPVAFQSDRLGGTLVLDLDSAFLFRADVLTTGFSDSGCIDILCLVDETYQTRASAYIKGAELLRFGVGYSRPVFSFREGYAYDGELIVGVRANIYRMGLSKQVIAFETVENDDIEDVFTDDYDNNQVTTTEIGLDVGLLWVAQNFQVGLTIANLNEPEFEFGEVGVSCSSFTSSSLDNCFTAQGFVNDGLIDSNETHTMTSLATIDAALRLHPQWYMALSLDIADYNDPVGDELQWFTLSTSYHPSSWKAPSFRIGYRSNLVGEELSSLNLGTTLFGVVNIDLLYGLDSTEVDGSSYPRNVAFNIGFEEHF